MSHDSPPRPSGPPPARRSRSGATLLPGGTNFAVASDIAAGMTLCLFDADGTEHQVPLVDNDAGVWHALRPRRRGGHGLRLPRRRPLGPVRAACAATRPSSCSTPTRARSAARSGSGPRCSATRSATPTSRARWTRPATCRAASSSTRPSTGRATSTRPTDYADTVFYEAHAKGLTRAAPRRARRAARHVRGPRAPRRDRAPRGPRA